ncbi:MAG TPA: hypothetical protein VK679_02315 [Gemmatimonadaceae bacterium]|jgi:hypothetical protein|nr:hypothetical protein [Gemmatimonadaceae bacterium]
MKKLTPLVLLLSMACHGDKKPAAAVAAAPPIDTTPVDLSKVQTALPKAAPDTFTPPPKPKSDVVQAPDYPPAPEPLMASVNRESAFSRFCFEEYGEKLDPTLRGGVAMLVTVSAQGVSDAKVANSRWSSKQPGAGVDQCLNEKAKLAWKLEPGEVRSGQYVVQMSFRGS